MAFLPTLSSAQAPTLAMGSTLANPQRQPSPAEQLASLLAQQQASQARLAQADEMSGAEYINNSGALGVLAAIANKYMGGRIARREGEKASELTQRILSAQSEAEAQKLIDAENRKAKAEQAARERRLQEGAQAGLADRELYEYAFTGNFPKGTEAPGSFREFQLAAKDPGYMAFLKESQASKGTKVNVTVPGQQYQKPFEEARAKSDVARYEKAQETAQAAQSSLNAINALENIFANTKTGKPQEFYGKVGQYFGAPAGATYQAQKAVVEQQVNAILTGLAGVATKSDEDRVRSMIPSMGTDPRARKVVVDFLKKNANAAIQNATAMEDYLYTNESLRGYRPQLRPFETDASPVGGRGLSPEGEAALKKYSGGR